MLQFSALKYDLSSRVRVFIFQGFLMCGVYWGIVVDCYFIHLTCSSRALFASFATGIRKPSAHPSSFRRFSICLTIVVSTKLLYPAIKASYYGVFTYTYCLHGNMTSSISCNSRETEGMKHMKTSMVIFMETATCT